MVQTDMIKTLNLKIDYDCASCAQVLNKTFKKLNLHDFTVNSISGEVWIEYYDSKIDEKDIVNSIKKLGYKFEII